MLDHPYKAFIHKVRKPARYLGGEYQSVRKDWSQVAVTVALAFPDLYDIGMSHLGTKILYKVLGDAPDIACERAFSPWVDMEAELRERGLPVLSLESARPLADFDVVGFSLQYEMTYTNVLNLLDLSGLALRACDRDESDPLIIAGGPTATHPEPIAPFIDAILVGDAEELLPRSLRLVGSMRRRAAPRREVLEALAALGGWYCPALYEVRTEPRNDLLVVDADASTGPFPVKRALLEDINAYPFPTDTPVPAAEAIFDRVSIEIARGCTEGCRFCQAGMIYRPVRERDPEQIVDAVMAAMDNGGYDEVSLTSLSTADYSCINPLIKKVMERIRERRASLSVSSLRAYGLSDDLLDEIASVKATGLTFAPEAGTQRMRDVVNKNISEEDILSTARRVFSRGWRRMKLYFMIGLPTEEDLDVIGIIETASKIRSIGLQSQGRRRIEVTASASSHVPKPHTPFQWAAMDSMGEIERKQEILRSLGREHNVTVRMHDARISHLEGIVARGDRRVADVIELAWRKGCRFDGWDDQLDWNAWMEAIDELGFDGSRYLGTLPVDGALPWDHIDVGLAPRFLEKEWKRACKDRLSPPCSKPMGVQVHHTNVADADEDRRKLICYHCGVACDLDAMRTERIDYLHALGADEPTAPRADDEMPEWKTVRVNSKGRLIPPERSEQGDAATWRMVFAKLGTVALSSQLDLTRMVPRILRRAGLTLKVSQGFSQKPVVVYGPALPLGIKSVAEVVDFTCLDEVSPTELASRLQAVADTGFGVLGLARLPEDAANCGRVAKLAEYLVAAPGKWSAVELDGAVTLLLGSEPLLQTVERKKGERVIDVRDGVLGASVDVPTEREVALLGLPHGAIVLRYRTDLNQGAHVRPTELIARLLQLDELPADAVVARTGLWGWRKDRAFPLLSPGQSVAAKEHETLPTLQDLGPNRDVPIRTSVLPSAMASS